MKSATMVKVYYQPELTQREWVKSPIPSFAVFARKKIAQRAFPGKEILRFTGAQIEEPTFVDFLYTVNPVRPSYAKS
ncbi:MAG: hypothetical protein IM631_12640 [Cytophagales bacterium]|nr:hypothetical protein [Cytophagales bacterium]MCA6382363.1 hypothetical protein [Cytophagales bacterium]